MVKYGEPVQQSSRITASDHLAPSVSSGLLGRRSCWLGAGYVTERVLGELFTAREGAHVLHVVGEILAHRSKPKGEVASGDGFRLTRQTVS